MAEIKKFLDLVGAEHLVDLVKAEDVKVKEAANAYADSLAKNYDAAGSAQTKADAALTSAKQYTDEVAATLENKGEAAKVQGNLDTEVQARKDADAALQGSIDAVSGVANKNKDDIAAINNAETGILAQAKADATEKANAVQTNIDVLAGKVGTVPEGSSVMEIITNIQENAYDDTELRGLINGLDSNKADKTQVATDIAAAVKVEEDARKEAVKGVQDAVDALSGTHATDKKALEDAIALKADQTALDAVSGVANAAATKTALEEEVNRAKGEEARIEGLVTAEAAKAREEEGKLDARLVEVETFFKTAEGETIDKAMDTLVEIQKYITDDGAAADEMVKDIAANAKAIEDHIATDHDFGAADEALKSELEGKINAKADKSYVDEELGKKANTTYVDEELAKKADKSYVDEELGKKANAQALTDAVAALEGVDAGQETRIAALEAKFGEGEGNVEDMIAEAKQAAIDTAAGDATSKANKALEDAKKYADDEDAKIEATIATLQNLVDTKAAQSDLTALDGRVTTVEGKVSTLETEMDAVEKKASDNETAIGTINTELAKKAAQSDLEAAVARIAKNEGDITSLNGTVAEKADQEDLNGALERLTAVETKADANASAIAAFVRIENSEIDALFA